MKKTSRSGLLSIFVFTLSLLLSLSISAEEESGNRVVIVVGTHHYSPQKTMPLFAKELEELGLETIVVNPEWNPEKGEKGIPGLEALAEADLAIFFVRFLKLKDEQLQHITHYLESGKPVMGLRTSTHGFNYPESNPNHKWNNGFGRDALGTRYLIHLTSETEVKVSEGAEAHPILTGVEPGAEWVSPGTLYLTDFPAENKDLQPLLVGTGNSKRVGEVTNQFGTLQLEKQMSDVMAWTWTNKWGGRTFTSSLGHPGDFAVKPSMRVMVNGAFWALGKPVPAADQEIGVLEQPGGKKSKKKK